MSEIKITTIDNNGTFADVIAGSSADVQAISLALRALLADVMPHITEVPWAKQKTIGYGVGAKKMSEHFCYIAPQANYVNLGFMYGADLPDPENLLEGNGKRLRHIKVRSRQDLDNPALRSLIKAASEHLPKLKK